MKNILIIVSLCVSGLLIIFSAFISLQIRINWGNIDFISTVTASILFMTLLAIVWYTIETNKMQKAVVYQTEVSVKPKLALFRREDKTFELVNIGNGVAINIHIEPVVISKEFWNITIEFGKKEGMLSEEVENLCYIFPEEKRTINVINKRNGQIVNFSHDAHLDEKVANRDFKIQIYYEDILGKRYSQEMLLGKSGPKVLGELIRK